MDMSSADLLWSFFVSAVSSYRKDFVVRPFPRGFIRDDGEKDFEHLVAVVGKCAALEVVNNNPEGQDPELLSLMKWVLNPKNFTMRRIDTQKFIGEHSELLGNSATAPSPDFVFEFVPSQSQEDKFTRLKGAASSIYAFHGSKVENFYSILNCGLRNNLNKLSLYGEGIYLSSDLNVVLHYSPMGNGWKHSTFGRVLSCVALCEMIDHPDVKCNLKLHEHESTIVGNEAPSNATAIKDYVTRKRRSKIKGSEGGEIPEKYFVVRNDDLVRIKYLMVYSPQAKYRNLKRQAGAANSAWFKNKWGRGFKWFI